MVAVGQPHSGASGPLCEDDQRHVGGAEPLGYRGTPPLSNVLSKGRLTRARLAANDDTAACWSSGGAARL